MFSEVAVYLKDSEKKLVKTFAIYENYSVNEHDPIIKNCIDSTLKDFGSDPDDVKIKITLEVR